VIAGRNQSAQKHLFFDRQRAWFQQLTKFDKRLLFVVGQKRLSGPAEMEESNIQFTICRQYVPASVIGTGMGKMG
jgi:hypothetical protein